VTKQATKIRNEDSITACNGMRVGVCPAEGRLIRAAGLRWPVEEDFAFSKDCFGLEQCQARLYTAIARHAVLVMAALAICAITTALLRDRTDTQALPPVRPDQPPLPEPGRIPLTIPEMVVCHGSVTYPARRTQPGLARTAFVDVVNRSIRAVAAAGRCP
jgi:hypothetical protein